MKKTYNKKLREILPAGTNIWTDDEISNDLISVAGYFKNVVPEIIKSNGMTLEYRITNIGSSTLISVSDENDDTIGYMRLDKYNYEGIVDGYQIGKSIVSPELKRNGIKGIGERMYIWALTKLKVLVTDYMQSPQSHAVWAKLATKYKVLGLNEKNGELFELEVDAGSKKLVSPSGKPPLYPGAFNIVAVMYDTPSSAPKLTEIWETGSFFIMDFSPKDVELFDDEPFKKVTDKWKAKDSVNGNDVNIMIFDEDETPMARIDLIGFQGYKYISWSAITSKYRRRGVGEAMYIYALINYGPLLSDEVQSRESHALWARLAKNPNIEVRGYDELRRKEFDVVVKDKTIVNASNKKDALVVYAKDNLDPTRLIMRWKGK